VNATRLLVGLALLWGVGGSAAAAAPAAEQRGLAYADASDPARTLDYLPPFNADGRPPLLAFVVGRFWGGEGEEQADLERLVVRPLRSEGAAVAVIRQRLAPRHSHPAFAEDVAAALGYLLAHAERLGFDPERVFLSGHASGAQLAALVALDPRYLSAQGLSPQQLAGVVPISGLYDLEDPELPEELVALVRQAFPARGDRSAASPLRHVRADAPPFLVLAANVEVPGLRAEAIGLSEALRAAGHPNAETFLASGYDHASVLDLGDLRNPARRHLLSFLGLGDAPSETGELMATRRYWREPRFSSEPFYAHTELVESHEADAGIAAWVSAYVSSSGSRRRIALARFDAIDLFAYLDAEAERVGSGRFLVLTDVRGRQAVLDLEALRPYAPLLVIGIDGERNLFRIIDVYHTLRRYTWRDAEPERWVLAHPLGAFVYFREPPPRELVASVFGLFALTPESLRRSAEDPLASLREGLDPELRDLLLTDAACVCCHRFRGAGARAGHLRARDGELVGGFALPLEEYPPEVLRRFLSEQDEVAREIGATMVPLDPGLREKLYEAVRRAAAAP